MKHKINGGQALTEFVILIPVFISVLLAIAWHSDILITKLQLITAARYGTDLIRHMNFDEQQVKETLNDFLVNKTVRKLKPDNLDINVKVSGCGADGIFNPQCSFVEIKYSYNLPNWMGGKIIISGRSEVLNGTQMLLSDHS